MEIANLFSLEPGRRAHWGNKSRRREVDQEAHRATARILLCPGKVVILPGQARIGTSQNCNDSDFHLLPSPRWSWDPLPTPPTFCDASFWLLSIQKVDGSWRWGAWLQGEYADVESWDQHLSWLHLGAGGSSRGRPSSWCPMGMKTGKVK